MDFTDNGAEQTLQWVLGQAAPTPPASLFIKLHIGDPGADGTGNPAANTERQQVTFATITSPGSSVEGSAQALTDAVVEWLNLPATETYSHISFWDDVTAGASWYKSELPTATPVLIGGSFKFDAAAGFVEHL